MSESTNKHEENEKLIEEIFEKGPIEDKLSDAQKKEIDGFLLKEYTELQSQLFKLTFVVEALSHSMKSLEHAQKMSNASVFSETEHLEELQKKLLELGSTKTETLVEESIKKQWKTRNVVTLLDRITIAVGAIIALIGTILAGGGYLK
jgi:hypothetical protein